MTVLTQRHSLLSQPNCTWEWQGSWLENPTSQHNHTTKHDHHKTWKYEKQTESYPAGMKWSHFIPMGMNLSQFILTGMKRPFQLEWNDMFIPTGMNWIHLIPVGMNHPFQSEWNDMSIPMGMKCHSKHRLKKYASWLEKSSLPGQRNIFPEKVSDKSSLPGKVSMATQQYCKLYHEVTGQWEVHSVLRPARMHIS